MKTIFIISFLMSSIGFAQADFAAQKQQMLTNIEQNIARMQDHKNCVSAAQKQEDMQKCRGMMREAHMERRMEKKMKHMQGKMPPGAPPAAPAPAAAPTEAPKQ
jgi:hypothetical protein